MASSELVDPVEYKNVRELVRSLESIDDLVAEAAQDGLWFQERHSDIIKLSATEEDVKRLEEAHNIYRDGCRMHDMMRYLDSIRDSQRMFDLLISSIIKFTSRTFMTERLQWVDWYERMQNAGDASWRKAVSASKTIGNADSVNALTKKYAAIDRALDVLNDRLSLGRKRPKFADEHQDTLLAIISLTEARGPYAPLNMADVNAVKFEIRRRRKMEDSPRDLAAAASSRSSVEEEGIEADQENQETSPSKPEAPMLDVQKWSSAVTATVAILFAVILAAIPGYKAWQYSPRQPGTIYDTDFWFLVQSSMMQFIGLLTVIVPLALSGTLRIQKWFWTWLLFGISFSCSIAPIPVYLYFPKEWSVTIAFLGSAAQTFVTLQALFVVQKQKTQ